MFWPWTGLLFNRSNNVIKSTLFQPLSFLRAWRYIITPTEALKLSSELSCWVNILTSTFFRFGGRPPPPPLLSREMKIMLLRKWLTVYKWPFVSVMTCAYVRWPTCMLCMRSNPCHDCISCMLIKIAGSGGKKMSDGCCSRTYRNRNAPSTPNNLFY